MLYRDWLNLNTHLLWCHDYAVDDKQTAPSSRLDRHYNA